MTQLDALPAFSSVQAPSVIVLEAYPGQQRRERLEQFLADARQCQRRAWYVDCDFDHDGPWSGVRELFGELVQEMKGTRPDLLSNHDYELVTVVPAIRRELTVKNPNLTDVAVSQEKVRNFPVDRAYRNVHGLINLLAEWRAPSSREPWIIVCDHFDRAGSLSRSFFTELMRRRSQQVNVVLVLAVAPAAVRSTLEGLPRGTALTHVRLALKSEPPPALAPEEAARRAAQLEQRMGEDMIEVETHLPAVVRYWRQSGDAEKLDKSLALAHSVANHYGMYEDALRYGEEVAPRLGRLLTESTLDRWVTLSNMLLSSYISTRRISKALELALEMQKHVRMPDARVRLYYSLSMLYGRYVPKPDLDRAEQYLMEGLRELEKADLPEDEKHFFYVFNQNGMAFLRHRQGRAREAIELCQAGLEWLNKHLSPDRHRLHRSVLVYNIAQVYGSLGEHQQAIAHYTAAIQMDPNYSEYYNERGSLLMRSHRLTEAVADFHKAIKLSPPYAEVYINLGQCLRLMKEDTQAAAAYATALDLDPARVLAWVGRAQAYESLGRNTEAIADYAAALELEPAQPMVLANKAALEFNEGRVERAVADLDKAIALAPQMADLYQNRAIALAECGKPREAVKDLQEYLRLMPQAEDRQEVEERIAELQRMGE